MRLLRAVEAVHSSQCTIEWFLYNAEVRLTAKGVKGILSCQLWLHIYVSIVNRSIEYDFKYYTGCCEFITYDVLLNFPSLFDLYKCDILYELCKKGALHDLIKIHDQFEWSQDDVPGTNWAFRVACSNGYLDIAKWLSTVFNLTVTDTDGAYLLAIFKHHQDVRDWLVTLLAKLLITKDKLE